MTLDIARNLPKLKISDIIKRVEKFIPKPLRFISVTNMRRNITDIVYMKNEESKNLTT